MFISKYIYLKDFYILISHIVKQNLKKRFKFKSFTLSQQTQYVESMLV